MHCTALYCTVGVIISKRQIGKALVFASVVPPREGMVVNQMAVRINVKRLLNTVLHFFLSISLKYSPTISAN